MKGLVRTGVQQRLDRAVALPDSQDVVATDRGLEEVTRLGNLRLVAQKLPRPPEDEVDLLLEDLFVGEDAPVDLTALHRYETIEFTVIDFYGHLLTFLKSSRRLAGVCHRALSARPPQVPHSGIQAWQTSSLAGPEALGCPSPLANHRGECDRDDQSATVEHVLDPTPVASNCSPKMPVSRP